MLFSMLGIIVTYQCNAMCDSCGPRCGPHRKERLSIDEIKQIVDEATECGSRVIIFTGGEPTLLGPGLEEVIRHASSRGNRVGMVSNGWWAKDERTALRKLQSFRDAGLTEISISADDWHLPYVPLERVAFAVDAARTLKLRTIVAVGEAIGSKITGKYLQQYLSGNPPIYREGMDERPEDIVTIRPVNLLPFGFAADKISEEEIHSLAPANDKDLAFLKRQGCPMVLRSPAIMPDGRVTACCSVFNEDNHSLVMGHWPQQGLREILEAGENDLLLNWIKFEGPFGIKDYIERHAPEIKFKPGYAGICHLCGDLLEREDTRKFLEQHLPELRDHVFALKLTRLSGLEMPIGCIESRMSRPVELQSCGAPNQRLTQIESRVAS